MTTQDQQVSSPAPAPADSAQADPVEPRYQVARSLVMVGLMGCGKSAIGRRLAAALGLDFVDADAAIEQAAGCTIAEIFERFGEAEFREGEARVITRLLEGPPCVLATGGGAYMNDQTRGLINQSGIAVWLRADLDLLVRRTAGRTHRPLLNVGDPRQTLARLIDQRYPIYAEAAVVVDVTDESPEVTCRRVREALEAHGAVTALPPSP
jgi:shikimate kinase